MIQRIQSVFIVLALLSVPLLWYLSSALQLDNKIIFFLALNFLIGFVSILLYRNRYLQYKLCLFNCLFGFSPIIFLCSSYYSTVFKMPIFYLIIMNIICYFLASRYIKKDINLINSSDRLR